MTDHRYVPVPFGWHDLDSARVQWVDAMHLEDEQLLEVLTAAQVLCEAYMPEGAPVSANIRQAHLLQARDIWNAIKTDGDGGVGPDGFNIPVYSMSRVVKGLLRPKRGVPYLR